MLAPDTIPPVFAVPAAIGALVAWLYLEWKARRHG